MSDYRNGFNQGRSHQEIATWRRVQPLLRDGFQIIKDLPEPYRDDIREILVQLAVETQPKSHD